MKAGQSANFSARTEAALHVTMWRASHKPSC
ncbi:hypothetical protein E2C01_087374 [Portunus trituberculatus]|uniref:Uncharacterized protein n=1 Tax=Portunus trituberculatus TaxID=210409 RepID=A0A5B7JJ24_PORTR|nr:hypothetical protein [Portunus trituberculatus]